MSPEKYYKSDPWLEPFKVVMDSRITRCRTKEHQLTASKTLADFAMGHYYYGLHRTGDGWVLREWAPNAKSICLTGTFSDWKELPSYKMHKINDQGDWEIRLDRKSVV